MNKIHLISHVNYWLFFNKKSLFLDLNVAEAYLKFENQIIPAQKFNDDFAGNDTILLFEEFKRVIRGLYTHASENGYDYKRFLEGGTIWPFSCDPHPPNPRVVAAHPTGQLWAHFRFKTPTEEVIV